MTHRFDINANAALSPSGERMVALKMASPTIELNVWLTPVEIAELSGARTLTVHASLTLGRSAGSAVHWARDQDGSFNVLIGHDDETWDIGVSLSEADFEDALAKAELVAAGSEHV